MGLEDLKAITAEYITPAVVAKVLRCNPQLIRVQAQTAPEKLGFPVCQVGSRIKIPRRAFIHFLEGDPAENQTGGN